MDRGDRNIWSALCVLVVVLAAGAYVSAGGYSRGFLPVSPSGGGSFDGGTIANDLVMSGADVDLADNRLYYDKVGDPDTFVSNDVQDDRVKWVVANNTALQLIGSTGTMALGVELQSNGNDFVLTQAADRIKHFGATQLDLSVDARLMVLDTAGTGRTDIYLGGTSSSEVRLRTTSANLFVERANGADSASANAHDFIIRDGASNTEARIIQNSKAFELSSDWTLDWYASTDISGGVDVGFERHAAGVVEVTDGAAGTGNLRLDRIDSVSGADPVLSSCGTTPAVVGSDFAGKITIGTGVTTSCTATFGAAFGAAPACVIVGDDSATTFQVTTTTTVLTIGSSADMDSDVINYHCIGL